MKKIYCAGPLFNAKEQEEMQEIASAFEAEGFETFLPQRDGLELCVLVEELVGMGIPNEEASRMLSKAIFSIDVYQVLEACDGLILNLNGRVPDEGAISEAAMAWCADKKVVAFKNDKRSIFFGEDNPLVAGLFGFEVFDTIEKAVFAMTHLFKEERPKEVLKDNINLKQSLDQGRLIWSAISKRSEIEARERASIIRDVMNSGLHSHTIRPNRFVANS